jgi:2-methoxy-6-polyprenyl-1,4-benzoquinol methylase
MFVRRSQLISVLMYRLFSLVHRYLVESIRKFPTQPQLVKRMEAAGFQMCTYENLTFGVVAIHSGFKL